ncbi:MAG: hypothetical protein CMC55_08785 [Flavobacteriaceae bacterium]|nr:hypothetical protein [Flavobacteriaceae bacterium]|tara:strand:- start:1322 stop:1624 length:303 start_codon:yes stop_codon:yes gene_type:complete
MNLETYQAQLKALKAKHEVELVDLYREYANANHKAHIGDIIIDTVDRIKVLKVSITLDHVTKVPYMVYHGIKLKKNNEPFKKPQFTKIHEVNIIEVIKSK